MVCVQLFLAVVCKCSQVFKIGLDELEVLVSSGKLGRLEEVLQVEGTLAVTALPETYTTAVRNLKVSAPECLEEAGLPEFKLSDGSRRTTFARSSEELAEYPECIREESKVIGETFDKVYDVVARLVTKVAGDKNLEWKTKHEEPPRNFSSLLEKEHIHVYRPPSTATDEDYVVPFHYDNGLLLMLTSFDKHPLRIKDKKGEEVSTADVGDDGMLILVARGLTDWLLQGTPSSSKFYAVPHAVPSLAGDIDSRTVFARMKVVPVDAMPCRMMEEGAKETYQVFEDFFNDHSPKSSMELCPMMKREANARQESWKELKSAECAGNSAYCWMNCLEIPADCPSIQNATCHNSKAEPCCTHPDKTEGCANMDSTCHWSCPAPPPSPEAPFCNGYGTDMYMNGFQASGKSKNPCVILLFESWVLNTRIKFMFGCIGVIVLGVVIEYMLCARRMIQSNKALIRLRNPWRKMTIIFLFGLNIGSGYLAMLVAMTYSLELFLCMVVGLVVGHAIFNSAAPVGESVDPCCASQREALIMKAGRDCEAVCPGKCSTEESFKRSSLSTLSCDNCA